MRVSEAESKLSSVISTAIRNWKNGHRTDVIVAIAALPTGAQAFVTKQIHVGIGGDLDEAWHKLLETRAILALTA